MHTIKKIVLFLLLFISNPSFAFPEYNLTEGVTPVSHDIYNLHMTIFWICVVIGTAVFSVITYSLIYHRKSRGAKAAHFHEHFWVEITWTIIPFLILVAMAIPATRVLLHMNDFAQPDLTIQVTGFQWKWRYDYLDQNIHFFSNISTPYNQMHGSEPKGPDYLREVDHPLVVPIHKKIRFLITSNDVIHGWWVPDLGVKHDAIPGFIYEAWARINKPGIYRGQCSKLCGLNHGFMPIVVIAMDEKDFDAWIIQQKGGTSPTPAPNTSPAPSATSSEKSPAVASKTSQKTPLPATAAAPTAPAAGKKITMDEAMKHGEQIFLGTCAACHKPDGTGSPPVFPALKGSKIATGPIDAHINTVLNGKSGTAMQAFRDQFSDDDLAAVITYERNAFGNNTGTIVQPADITAAKAKK